MEEINVNRIRKKLQSNSGASVMIALGLFLICIMISSVVVTAAASGSSRNRKDRIEQQREYLSISSAAQTVMDEINKLTQYVGRETDSDYACNDFCSNFNVAEAETITYLDADNNELEVKGWRLPFENASLSGEIGATDILIPCAGVYEDNDKWDVRTKYLTEEQELTPEYVNALPPTVEKTELEGAFAEVVEAAMKKMYVDNLAGMETSFTEEFTIQLPIGTTDDRIKAVKCKFKMDSDYSITIEMTMDNSDYALTVFAKAKKTEEITRITDGSGPDGLKCTHTICYKYLDGGKFEYGTQAIELPGIREITTTKVEWDEPRLLKGITEEVGGGAS